MPLARLLPERWHKFLHEAFKFGLVGGINTVINYAVFNALALTVFVDGQLKAAVVATVVATITSYLMNRHWTYRDRPKSAMRREYALFFFFNGVGLLIELGVLAAAKYGLGVTGLLALNIAKTGGVVLATLFRFWSYRTFVFQPAAPAEAPRRGRACRATSGTRWPRWTRWPNSPSRSRNWRKRSHRRGSRATATAPSSHEPVR